VLRPEGLPQIDSQLLCSRRLGILARFFMKMERTFMRKYLVAGNWKMNGSRAANRALLDGIAEGLSDAIGEGSNVDVLVCPPFPYIPDVAVFCADHGLKLGAQNVSQYEDGAYTGETSATMLGDIGCEYVIVGHSERRALFAESNEVVAQKFAVALQHGLIPILCVGETLEHREAGQTEAVIESQINAVLSDSGIAAFAGAVVAYEPVWAIGTGKTASPEQAQEVHMRIRALLAEKDAQVAEQVQILYGGSVKGANAAGLFSNDDIDGGLIGGAALDASNFLAIADVANSLS